MHNLIRSWIVDIVEHRQTLLSLALRQRAKFEGWLKFELADRALVEGATDIQVEPPYSADPNLHGDVAFKFGSAEYFVELKTATTNWRMEGIKNATRPITKNIQGVIEDGRKLRKLNGRGSLVFAMFPVRHEDDQWLRYLDRIANSLGLELSATDCSTRVTVNLEAAEKADVIVVTIPINEALSGSAV